MLVAFRLSGLTFAADPCAGTGSEEEQLAALGAVGGIAQKVESEQRVIIENAEGGADDRLAVALGFQAMPMRG